MNNRKAFDEGTEIGREWLEENSPSHGEVTKAVVEADELCNEAVANGDDLEANRQRGLIDELETYLASYNTAREYQDEIWRLERTIVWADKACDRPGISRMQYDQLQSIRKKSIRKLDQLKVELSELKS